MTARTEVAPARLDSTKQHIAASGTNGFPYWLRVSLPALVLLLVTAGSLRPVKDPDTFWHLATGDWLRQHWQFSGPDPWSPMSTRAWTLHEWLPELLLSLVQQAFGLIGVAMLLPVGVAGVALCVLVVCRQRSSLLVSSVVTTVVVVAMTGSLSLRPQLVTFAFTAVSMGAWLGSATDGRPRWWLIPLTWLWACSHGMWFVGVAIGLIATVGVALDRTRAIRHSWKFGSVLTGSVIAAALTPVGPRLLLAPLEVSNYTKFVTEWAAPSLSDLQFVVFILLAGGPLLIFLRRSQPVPWSSVLLFGFGVIVGIAYMRTIAVGAAILAPLAAEALQNVTRQSVERRTRMERCLRTLSVLVAMVVVALMAPARDSLPRGVPNELNSVLDRIPSGTVVCNSYQLGGWLIWRHPNLRPVVDGRTEIYSVEHIEAYQSFTQASPGWQGLLTASGCAFALVSSDAPVAEALEARLGWARVGEADSYVLLQQPS